MLIDRGVSETETLIDISRHLIVALRVRVGGQLAHPLTCTTTPLRYANPGTATTYPFHHKVRINGAIGRPARYGLTREHIVAGTQITVHEGHRSAAHLCGAQSEIQFKRIHTFIDV